jgi:hypothetical protein
LVLVLVVGGGSGWVIHRARVQHDAVAVIRRAGGEVAYDSQWSYGARASRGITRPGWPNALTPRSAWPGWLRRALGPDLFDTVTYVRLYGPQCDDAILRAACQLSGLEELIVIDTAITDAGADELWRLGNLRSLDLRLNPISARPLRHVGGMRELRELTLAMKLSPVRLRDEDMLFLTGLTKLESLMLPSRDLTGAWLVYLDGLTRLKQLQVYDMSLTPEDLERLRGLPNLSAVLTLQGTQIPLRKPGAGAPGLDVAKTHPLLLLSRRK